MLQEFALSFNGDKLSNTSNFNVYFDHDLARCSCYYFTIYTLTHIRQTALMIKSCNCTYGGIDDDRDEVINRMRFPVKNRPVVSRGQFLGHVHCASTGSPIASGKIKVQPFWSCWDPFCGEQRW